MNLMFIQIFFLTLVDCNITDSNPYLYIYRGNAILLQWLRVLLNQKLPRGKLWMGDVALRLSHQNIHLILIDMDSLKKG